MTGYLFIKENRMDCTLSDDAWKDSFDRLLDHRPQLRELNVLKKNVRASFNIDSSIENTNPNLLSVSDCSLQNPNELDVDRSVSTNEKKGSSISTPCARRLSSNLFHCALSPITGMNLIALQATESRKLDKIEEKEPRTKKQVCFEINLLTPDKSNGLSVRRSSQVLPIETRRKCRSSLVLQPGKWRKSLNCWRRTYQNEIAQSLSPKKSVPSRIYSTDGLSVNLVAQRKSVYVNGSIEPNVISYEAEVLKYCDQIKPQKFCNTYSSARMMNTCKIGEGVYGEVFKYTPKSSSNANVVLKVLPIEGTALVNGEVQKTFEQILPEIIISKEMSNLRTNKTNSTAGFVDIYNVCLVKGKYPKHLIKLWEDYDNEKESENDHPNMFTDNQLFIVLELKFAGEDMSSFVFTNAEQAYYALQQIIVTLAVGEEAFQFEHRDLHWGNILIEKTDAKYIPYKLQGNDLTVATKGIQITIIDYTLSRMTVDKCCHYNDLSNDEELFVATGDYQYDIYRMMRNELKNDWAAYSARTNVQWLSYITSKLIEGAKYKSPVTKAHRTYMEKLKAFNNIVLTFNSAVNCVENLLDS